MTTNNSILAAIPSQDTFRISSYPSSISGRWEKGSWKVKYDPVNLLQAQAVLTKLDTLGKIITEKVFWHLEDLSTKKCIKLLREQPENFNIKVVESVQPFEVHIYVNKMALNEQRVHKYLDNLNQIIFTGELVRLDRYVNWVCKKREKALEILLKIILSARENPTNAYAATNAITIWVRAGYPLNDLDLHDVPIPQANLSGAVLGRTDFSGANLKGVNLTNAYLDHTIFNDTSLSEVELGQLPPLIHEREIIHAVVLSDERYLISFTLGYIYLWDLLQGKLIKKVEISKVIPEVFSFVGLALSNDDKFLFTGDSNREGCIHVWKSHSLDLIKSFKTTHYMTRLHCSPDGQFLITSGDSKLCTWKINTSDEKNIQLEQVAVVNDLKNIKNLRFSSTESLVGVLTEPLTKPSCIDILSLPSMDKVASLTVQDVEELLEGEHPLFWVYDMQFSLKRNRLVIALRKLVYDNLVPREVSRVCEWDWEKNTTQELFYEDSKVKDIHLLQISRQLVFVANKTQIGLYDLNVRKKTVNFEDFYINDNDEGNELTLLKLSQKEELLIGFVSKKIFVWKKRNVENGSILDNLKTIVDFGFSQDSQYILLAHSSRNLMKYEVSTGKVVGEKKFKKSQTFPCQEKSGVSYFSPNANYIISKPNPLPTSYEFSQYPYANLRNLVNGYETRYKQAKVINTSGEDIFTSLSSIMALDESSYVVSVNEETNQLEVSNFLLGQQLIPIKLPSKTIYPWGHLSISKNLFPKGYIALARGSEVYLWETSEKKSHPVYVECGKLGDFNPFITLLSFSENYLLIHTLYGKIIIVDAKDGTCKQIREGGKNDAMRLGLARESPLLAGCTIHRECVVHFWNIATGEKLHEIRVPFRPLKLCLSPKGDSLAVWSPPHFLHVWDTSQVEKKIVRLRWRLPQNLEVKGLNLDKVRGLSKENRAVFKQLNSN